MAKDSIVEVPYILCEGNHELGIHDALMVKTLYWEDELASVLCEFGFDRNGCVYTSPCIILDMEDLSRKLLERGFKLIETDLEVF